MALIDVNGFEEGDIDIAVLKTPNLFGREYPLPPFSKGLQYGQLVYFLGFPYGEDGGREEINWGFPFPFVKTGIVCFFE